MHASKTVKLTKSSFSKVILATPGYDSWCYWGGQRSQVSPEVTLVRYMGNLFPVVAEQTRPGV